MDIKILFWIRKSDKLYLNSTMNHNVPLCCVIIKVKKANMTRSFSMRFFLPSTNNEMTLIVFSAYPQLYN